MAALTLETIPAYKTLDDGSALLAESKAYVLLEGGPTRHCGSLVNEHRVQLVRHSGAQFELIVHAREGEPGGVSKLRLDDGKVSISPALASLRREPHFVKPDGEGLLKAINNHDGDEINLYTFDVVHSSGTPLLDLFGIQRTTVGLGWTSMEEALGWYVYIGVCAGLMSPEDADARKVLGSHSMVERVASIHAPMLNM